MGWLALVCLWTSPRAQAYLGLTCQSDTICLSQCPWSPLTLRSQLRQILVMQHRQIVAQSISADRPNPLRDLPPSLDPTTSFQGANALVTKAEFEKQIAAAEKDVRDKLASRVQNAAARASTPTASGTGAGGTTQSPIGTPTGTPTGSNILQGTPSPTVTAQVLASLPLPLPLPVQVPVPAPVPSTAAVPMSVARPATPNAGTVPAPVSAVMTPGGVRPPGTPQTGQPVRPVVRPLPPGLFNAKEMKTFVDMSRETRERYLNSVRCPLACVLVPIPSQGRSYRKYMAWLTRIM
jgi:hypothetical protein